MKKCRHASCTVVITLLLNFSLASACQFRASCQLMAISSGSSQEIGSEDPEPEPRPEPDSCRELESRPELESYPELESRPVIIHNLKNVVVIGGKPHKPSWENEALKDGIPWRTPGRIGGWYPMDNKMSDILEEKKKEKWDWHMKAGPTKRHVHIYDLKNMTQYIQLWDGGMKIWKTIIGNDGSMEALEYGIPDWKMRRIYQEVTFSYKLKQKIKKIHGGRRFLLDLQEEDSSLTYGPLKSKKEKYKTEKKQAGMQVKKKSMKVKKVKQA